MEADDDSEDERPRGERDESTDQSSHSASSDRFDDYYELLDISPDASQAAVTRAYRLAAKRHHPDASDLSEPEAERLFRKVVAARDVLTNAETRRAYDALGHEAYCRQSDTLGEHIRHGDSDGDSTRNEESSDPEFGRGQRSARGEAHRRGEPLVPPTTDALTSSQAHEDDSGRDTGRSIYHLDTDAASVESTSLRVVATRWGATWRARVALGVGIPAIALGIISGGPGLLDAAGSGGSMPAATPTRLYLLSLGAALISTVYGCLTAERTLPRGVFLADRDLGRFSVATSRRFRWYGATALAAVLVLVGVTANSAVDPWTHTAESLRGNRDGFPWFDATGTGFDGWTATLDILVTSAFAVAATVGLALFSLGMSATVWRSRYEDGVRFRPSLWEPVFVLALVSTPVALVAGPIALFSVSGLAALPVTASAVLAINDGMVTVATLAVAGIVLSLASMGVYRLRLVIHSKRRSAETDGNGSD